MSGWYTVQAGDCISSIAFGQGLFWQTVWNDPNNASLRDLRKDPNVLAEGDQVFLPDLRVNKEHCPTDATHTFVLKGAAAKLKLRLMVNGQPRANAKYILIVDGASTDGTTDGNGNLEHPIPPDASEGKLIIVNNGVKEEHALALGDLDPINTVSGVKDRLTNLGYDCDTGDDVSDKFKQALSDFQTDRQLPVTGELDDDTRSKLKQMHGF